MSMMSIDTLSRSCGSRNNRVRTVRLVKRINGHMTLNSRQALSLGFSIRGGYEHGTGFFVSNIEIGTEAHAQGLKVGDQIIRINGFAVEDATHKEVVQLITNFTHLKLKVRDVGMIPVKEVKSDPLSWQIIPNACSSSRSSPQLCEKNRDILINVFVAARSKLGCGICKGPDWKPGIFVQFTKEGGIAREAGLRPGDQILQCNNVDFADIPFNEAVNLMKTSRQLELLVRKAAASELFPGESSGYNSSASSVTEDQSLSWAESKRLSIVKEENQDIEDRLAQNKRISNIKKWKMEDWCEEPQESKFFKPTIINLSENGSTIENNGTECQNIVSSSSKINEPANPLKESQIVVEVHRSDVDDSNNKSKLSKSPSISSFGSFASSSLSSAISMEIERRVKKQSDRESSINIEDQIEMKKKLKGINSDQQYQHTMLMNEFKQAHQKMFKASDGETMEQNVMETNKMNQLIHKDLSHKLTNKLQNLVTCDELMRNNRQMTSSIPPPPPPPPSTNLAMKISTTSQSPAMSFTSTLKLNKTKQKAPPVPVKHSVLSYHQPPPCPTPDYDTLSISSSTSSIRPDNQKKTFIQQMTNISNVVGFQTSNNSFSSFKSESSKFTPSNNIRSNSLLSPQMSNNSISSFSTERPKSINVTVGEYAGAKTQPRRLDCLKNEVEKFNGMTDELTQTLNRFNLRKRTESMDNLLSIQQIKPQSNGSVRICLSKEFTKSTSDLTEDCDRFSFKSKNRIMINVNQDRKFDLASNSSYG